MYYEYWVEYYNEIDEVTDKASGVVYAETYFEAASSIADYYGENNIEKLEFRSTEEGTVYEIEDRKND